jgi:hypothetical protein
MSGQFTAIVEDGRLRPLAPLGLPDGTSVEVYIVGQSTSSHESKSPAEILAAIASLASEPVDPTTSVRHDEVLYDRGAHP